MIQPTISLAAVRVADTLPILEKTFTKVDLVAYGAATWDWHRIHYDEAFARDMKLPNVVVDGQAFGALFARAAVAWAGPRAFVARMSFKMKSMAFAGDPLRVEGEVVEVEDGAVVLVQRLTTGARLVSEARTELRLPA